MLIEFDRYRQRVIYSGLRHFDSVLQSTLSLVLSARSSSEMQGVHRPGNRPLTSYHDPQERVTRVRSAPFAAIQTLPCADGHHCHPLSLRTLEQHRRSRPFAQTLRPTYLTFANSLRHAHCTKIMDRMGLPAFTHLRERSPRHLEESGASSKRLVL